MHLAEQDWRRLEELRHAFLGEERSLGEVVADYWHDERDLELYDAFYGRRIAWKWAGALDELVARGWRPPSGALLDFGCGTGSAAQAYLDAFGPEGVDSLLLVDRSAQARNFAQRTLGTRWPDLALATSDPRDLEREGFEPPAVLLVSHVLNELEVPDLERLLALARRAQAVLWLEPGQHNSSRALSRVHDRLLEGARILAPCPHQRECGALAQPEEWCHHFARAPVDAFTTREWTLFSKRLGIDLRSLPFAWLALENLPAGTSAAHDETGLGRVLGRVRQDKGRLWAHLCTAQGVDEVLLLDRDAKPLSKLLREPKGRPLLLRADVVDGRIVSGAAEQPSLDAR